MFKFFSSLILIAIYYLPLHSQNLVGILNQSITITPSYTVNNNTSINVIGQVVNTGTITITGTIHVNIAIDTSSTSIPKYYWRSTMSYPVSNFQPNATLAFSVSDVASGGNAYKVAGNGTTVVAWPVVGLADDTLTCSDSAFANVYVLPIPQGINELEKLKKELDQWPNPIQENIILSHIENYQIELVDINGKVFFIENNEIRIEDFTSGFYLLRISNKKGDQINKKLIFE